jgi:hypothetical protein
MGRRRSKYPHLLSPDVPVWERFLAAHRHAYPTIEYDVRVGQGRDPGDEFLENTRRLAMDLSKRRIDAVLITDNAITCVEVTTQAGLKALGQAIAYPILYALTYTPDRPIQTLIVCATIEDDLVEVYNQVGVPVTIV